MPPFQSGLSLPAALMDPLLIRHVHSHFYSDIQPAYLLIIEHTVGIKMHIYGNYAFCIVNYGLHNAECLMLKIDSSVTQTNHDQYSVQVLELQRRGRPMNIGSTFRILSHFVIKQTIFDEAVNTLTMHRRPIN
ncbi:hypothetical protein DFH28DRAFT_1162359 [Melampsora americana]|nr:hypothetical protein DFH28DRAFT_1162359 [Melampsora americana]